MTSPYVYPNAALGLQDTLTVAMDANREGQIRISNQNAAVLWIVRQISVITRPTTSGCTCTLSPPIGIIDTSYFAGTGDVAGGDPPIYLRSGDFIDALFANGPVGGIGILTYIYDEVPF